jgi:S-DNA-T family DNA segregation ATPase FtsK/SpoIIIE
LKPSKYNKEIIGIISFSLAVFIGISLFSYNSNDISFSNIDNRGISNLGGWVGAYLSNILFQVIGLSSYLIPFILLYVSINFFIDKEFKKSEFIGIVTFIISGSSIIALTFPYVSINGNRILGGGIFGSFISNILIEYFNITGTFILLLSAVILSIILIGNVSVYSLFKSISIKRSPLKVNTKQNVPVTQDADVSIKPEIDSKSMTDQGYQAPPISLLNSPGSSVSKLEKDELINNSKILEDRLKGFGVNGKIVEVHPGPVITIYEFEPAPGVKINKIVNLSHDLSLALKAPSIRIVAPIPGKSVVGIEIPNTVRDTVYLKEILKSNEFNNSKSKLTLALGKDIFGNPVITDLTKMPHLLIAGATGAGKSVGLNSMICSILYKATPDDVKLMMIDPKMLELSLYDGIPHLLIPIVTDYKKSAPALKGIVEEMENRYRIMADIGVRNIDRYNQKVGKEGKKIPYIVVIIDELADLMIVSAREVEESIARLAQMARAAGIHLIVATQRPSVDVLTGIIKVNFPARISFKVTSRVDSRTILDAIGAESLLGSGDMLFLPPGTSKLKRIHGAYISELEIKRVVNFLRKYKTPEYNEEIMKWGESDFNEDEEQDEKYKEAVEIVLQTGQASISLIQRRLKIGFNRAARMIEMMEKEGIVGPQEGGKPREVLLKE